MDWLAFGIAVAITVIVIGPMVAIDIATRTPFDRVDEAICDLWQMGRITEQEAERRVQENNARARRFWSVSALYKANRA